VDATGKRSLPQITQMAQINEKIFLDLRHLRDLRQTALREKYLKPSPGPFS
jgi:hypothetical protein